MAENAPFDVVLIEGNHEDLHRRYRRNLIERPEIAAGQAERHTDLAELTAALTAEDIAFLDAAVPFYRIDCLDILAVHGGIPGDMVRFPQSVAESEAMTGKEKRAFSKILRTRFIDKTSGAFVANGDEAEGDPFWAYAYDGRFGKIVFGHTPFMDGIARFPHAIGIDTGAVYGGKLTAMTIGPDCSTNFTSVAAW
jgi:diadenosine tetraphosphatase ApaH/serine/threonine PP2A family protein phosphatase